MSDESLLRDMARVAREQEAEQGPWLDKRWSRLFAGKLPPEEEAALAALAAESEEALETFEAFRPLGPDFAARTVERWNRLFAGELPPEEEAALAAMAAESEEALETFEAFRPLGPDFAARAVEASVKQRSTPAPAPPVWHWKARAGSWVAAAAVSLAATFTLLWWPPPAVLLPVMAAYELKISGDQADRSGSAKPEGPVIVQAGYLAIKLIPDTGVTGPIDVRCFLEKDGQLGTWDVRPQRKKNGVFEFGDSLGRTPLKPGHYRLWTVIGRPDKLPSNPELMRLLRLRTPKLGGRDWVVPLPKEFQIM